MNTEYVLRQFVFDNGVVEGALQGMALRRGMVVIWVTGSNRPAFLNPHTYELTFPPKNRVDLFSELDEWEIINPFDYHTGEDLKLNGWIRF